MSGPLPPSTPHSLLGRMLQRGPNDEDAWREFVERYGPLVAAWCLGGDLQDSDAKDVIQEVLLRLYRYLRSYQRSDGRFRDWLRSVVHNAMIDYRTKEGRDRMATQSLDAVAAPPDPASLEEQMGNQFQREIGSIPKMWQIATSLIANSIRNSLSDNVLRIINTL